MIYFCLSKAFDKVTNRKLLTEVVISYSHMYSHVAPSGIGSWSRCKIQNVDEDISTLTEPIQSHEKLKTLCSIHRYYQSV